MPRAVMVRDDYATSEQLRAQAEAASRPRTRLRLLAIADLLDGRLRAEVSATLGLDRQALHDAVRNYNRDGPAGLVNRPRGHRRPTLSEEERATVAAFVRAASAGRRGPSVKEVCAFVAADLDKTVHPWTVARLLRALRGLPHPHPDDGGQAAAEREIQIRV